MKISKVNDPEDLNILKDKRASYEKINFGFSDEYLDKLKGMFSKNGSLQLIAEEKGRFFGYIASIPSEHWPEHLEIIELFVGPAFQGKGVGTNLVGQIIDFAKTTSKEGVIVQTEKENLPAQNLYVKLGFVPIENPEWQNGVTYRISFKSPQRIQI